MNEIVREWIKKAEGDYNTALREYRVRKNPNYDAAGFHAQQSIEKYLKAILQMHNIPFGKIEILNKKNGQPYVEILDNNFADFEIKISLSLSREIAIAFVIINKDSKLLSNKPTLLI